MAVNAVFHDPDFHVPRRPLAPHRIYHFNVIYNHGAGSDSTRQTEDTELALRVTQTLVARLELKGYVNSYYHDRDFRRLNKSETELDRVLRGSSVTVLILTPGFLTKCRQLYFSSDSFSRLIGEPRSTRRLLSLSVGVVRSQVPPELTADDVLYFGRDWEVDIPMWARIDNTVETLYSCSYTPIRESCVNYDKVAIKPRKRFQDQYQTSHKRSPSIIHELDFTSASYTIRSDPFVATRDMIDRESCQTEQYRLNETGRKTSLKKDLDLQYHEISERSLAKFRMQNSISVSSKLSSSSDTYEALMRSGYSCYPLGIDFEKTARESSTELTHGHVCNPMHDRKFSQPCSHRKSDDLGRKRSFDCSDYVLFSGYGESGGGLLRDQRETSSHDKHSINIYAERAPSRFQYGSSSLLSDSCNLFSDQSFEDLENGKESYMQQNVQLLGNINVSRENDRWCKNSDDLNRWTCADKWNKWTQGTSRKTSGHGVVSHTDEFKNTPDFSRTTNKYEDLVTNGFSKQMSVAHSNQSRQTSKDRTHSECNKWTLGDNTTKCSSTKDFLRSLSDDLFISRLDDATTHITTGKQQVDIQQYTQSRVDHSYSNSASPSITGSRETLDSLHFNLMKPKGALRNEGRDKCSRVNLSTRKDDEKVITRRQKAVSEDVYSSPASESPEWYTYKTGGYDTKSSSVRSRMRDYDQLTSTDSTGYNYSPSSNIQRQFMTHSYGTARDTLKDYSIQDSFESYTHEDFEYPVRDNDLDLHLRPSAHVTLDLHHYSTPTDNLDVFSSTLFEENQRALNGHSSLPSETRSLTEHVSELYSNKDWGSRTSELHRKKTKHLTNTDMSSHKSVIDKCSIKSDFDSHSSQTYPAVEQDEATFCEAESDVKCEDFNQAQLHSHSLKDRVSSLVERDFTLGDNYQLYDSKEQAEWHNGSLFLSWGHQLTDCVTPQTDTVNWDNCLGSTNLGTETTMLDPKICVSSNTQTDLDLDNIFGREGLDKQYRDIGTDGDLYDKQYRDIGTDGDLYDNQYHDIGIEDDQYESWDTPIHVNTTRDVKQRTELHIDAKNDATSFSIQEKETTNYSNERQDIQLPRSGSLNPNQLHVGPTETLYSKAEVKNVKDESVKDATENIVAARIALYLKKEPALKAFIRSTQPGTVTQCFDIQECYRREDSNLEQTESDSKTFQISTEHVPVEIAQTKAFAYADDNTPGVPDPVRFSTPQYDPVGACSKQAVEVRQSKINNCEVFDVQTNNTDRVPSPGNVISRGEVGHLSRSCYPESRDLKLEPPFCTSAVLNLEEITTSSHTVHTIERNGRPAISQDKIIARDFTDTDLISRSGESVLEHVVNSEDKDQLSPRDVITELAQRGGNKMGGGNTAVSSELTGEVIRGITETKKINSDHSKSKEIKQGIEKTDKINIDTGRSIEMKDNFLEKEEISETKEINYEHVETDKINHNIQKAAEINRDTVKTEEINSDIVKTDKINSDIVKTEEINSDIVKTEEINQDIVKTEIINQDIVKTEEINQDIVKTEEINSIIVKTEEINSDIVKTEEINSDIVKTEEINQDIVKTDEINQDIVKTDEINQDIVKTDEINQDIVKTDEINQDIVKTDEINQDIVKTDEINQDIVKTDEINQDIVKTEEINSNIVKTDKINQDIVKTDEINQDIVKTDEINQDIVKTEEINSNIVKTEEINSNIVKTEEINQDIVKTDEINQDIVKTDEINQDIVKTDEINQDIVKTDEINQDIVKTEEINQDIVKTEEINQDIVKTEEINSNIVKTNEINQDIVKTDEINQDIVKTEEINSDIVKTEEIIQNIVKTEENISDIDKIEEINSDIVKTDEINSDIVKTEEIIQNIVKTEENISDIDKIEEINSDIVKTDEINSDIVKTEEINSDIVKTEKINQDIVKTEEIMQNIVKTEDNISDIDKVEEINSDIVKTDEINSDIVKTEEIIQNIVKTEENISDIDKIEEINSDIVKTEENISDIDKIEEINSDIVKTDEINSDFVKTAEIYSDIVKTESIKPIAATSAIPITESKQSMKVSEELIYQAANDEEINNETLWPIIASGDTEPLSGLTEITVLGHNINVESVVTQASTLETVSVQEVGHSNSSRETAHRENVTEDNNLDFETLEDSNLENETVVIHVGNMSKDTNIEVMISEGIRVENLDIMTLDDMGLENPEGMTLGDLIMDNVTEEDESIRYDSKVENGTAGNASLDLRTLETADLENRTAENEKLAVNKRESSWKNLSEDKGLEIMFAENSIPENETEDKILELTTAENSIPENGTEDKILELTTAENSIPENETEDKILELTTAENSIPGNRTEDKSLELMTAEISFPENETEDKSLELTTAENSIPENKTEDKSLKLMTAENSIPENETEDKILELTTAENSIPENKTEDKSLELTTAENSFPENETKDKSLELTTAEYSFPENETEDKSLELMTTENSFPENETKDKSLEIMTAENKSLELTTAENSFPENDTVDKSLEIMTAENKGLEIMTLENSILENETEDKSLEIMTAENKGLEIMTLENSILENDTVDKSLEIMTAENKGLEIMTLENSILENETEDKSLEIMTAENKGLEIMTLENSILENETEDKSLEIMTAENKGLEIMTLENSILENKTDDKILEIMTVENAILENETKDKSLEIITAGNSILENETEDNENEINQENETIKTSNVTDNNLLCITSEEINQGCVRRKDITQNTESIKVEIEEYKQNGTAIQGGNLETVAANLMKGDDDKCDGVNVETGGYDTSDSNHVTPEETNNTYVEDHVEEVNFQADVITNEFSQSRRNIVSTEIGGIESSIQDTVFVHEELSNLPSVDKKTLSSDETKASDATKDKNVLAPLCGGESENTTLQNDILSFHIDGTVGKTNEPVETNSSFVDVMDTKDNVDGSNENLVPQWTVEMDIPVCPDKEMDSFNISIQTVTACDRVDFNKSEIQQCPVSNITSVPDSSEVQHSPVSNISSVCDNSEVQNSPVSNISSLREDTVNQNQDMELHKKFLVESHGDSLKSNLIVDDESHSVTHEEAKLSELDNNEVKHSVVEDLEFSAFGTGRSIEFNPCLLDYTVKESTHGTQNKNDDLSENISDSQLLAGEITTFNQNSNLTDTSLEPLGNDDEALKKTGDNLQSKHQNMLLSEKCSTLQANFGQETSSETEQDSREVANNDISLGIETFELTRQEADTRLHSTLQTMTESKQGRDSVNVTSQTSKTFSEFCEGLSHEFDPSLNKTRNKEYGLSVGVLTSSKEAQDLLAGENLNVSNEPNVYSFSIDRPSLHGIKENRHTQEVKRKETIVQSLTNESELGLRYLYAEHTVTTSTDQVDGIERGNISLVGSGTSSRDQPLMNAGSDVTELTYQDSTDGCDEATSGGDGIADVSYTSIVTDENVGAGDMPDEHSVRTRDKCKAKEWILPVYKGVCHSLTNPEMPFIG